MSVNANFNKPSSDNARGPGSGDPKDVIPASDLSDLQRGIDTRSIWALSTGLLIQIQPYTGERRVAENYFAPSLQRVIEVETENGGYRYEAAGGWVTRAEARLVLQELETTSVTSLEVAAEQGPPIKVAA